MITDNKITEIFCTEDEFSKNFDSELEKNLLSASGKQRRRRKANTSDSEIMTVQLMFVFQTFLHPLHPWQPQGPFPHGSVVQPVRGVGEPRVLRHDVLLENERVRQMQRRELRGLHHDTRLPQRQAIHEQGVQWVCQRRKGDDGLVPWVQAALRLQRPGGNHHLLPHHG